MDDSIQAFLAACPPRVLSRADLVSLSEWFPSNLLPATAAWLAPFSPLLLASSAATASARAISSGVVMGMASAVALDQVVRPVGASAGDPATPGAVDGLGPPMAITSSIHVPVAVEGPYVHCLSISDVVLDAVGLVEVVNPVLRCVDDTANHVFMMMGVYGDGSTVSASSIHVGKDDGALTITSSILKRPTLPGGCATLLMRSSSRIVGETQQAHHEVHASPKDAYLSFIFRMVGQFGCAALPLMVGGGDAATVGDPSLPRPPPMMSSTIFCELSSMSVVARLAALVLQQGAIQPLRLRVGPAIVGGSRPIAAAPSDRWGRSVEVDEGAGFSAGTPLTVRRRGVPTARSSGARTRTRVCLDQVFDKTERARIVRNRASAARSNAKRRAQREAAARDR